MSYVDRIIGKFGGIRALARAMDGRVHQDVALKCGPSTVQGWKEAGVVPARWQPILIIMGRELGIDIGPEDFFEPEVLAQPVAEVAA